MNDKKKKPEKPFKKLTVEDLAGIIGGIGGDGVGDFYKPKEDDYYKSQVNQLADELA